MNATEIVHELRQAGAVIEARGDRLHVEAPKGVLTIARREALSRHKRELLVLLEAVAGTTWSLDDLYAALSDEDRADLAVGDLRAEALRAFIHAIDTRRAIEAGRVPAHFDEPAHCRRCGPVWLWISASVHGCPWCRNRIAGRPIPRPQNESAGRGTGTGTG